MNIQTIILIAIIEVFSICVKKFWDKGTKFIPLFNTAVTFIFSLVFKMDLFSAIATLGFTTLGWDAAYGLYKAIRDAYQTKKLEAKNE